MPGAVDLDADNIKPMSGIAYQDSEGNWHAGESAVENGHADYVGQFVSEDYADRARSVRQHANAVKQNMRKQDMPESEARERVNEWTEKYRQEIESENPDPERIARIQRKIGGS